MPMPTRPEKETTLRIIQILNDLNRDLVVRDRPEEILPQILAAALSLLPATVCGLWRRESGRVPAAMLLEAVRGAAGRRPFPLTLKLSGSISQGVLQSRRCRVVPDLADEPDGVEKAIASQRGLVAFVCVPVVVDATDPVGVLHCYGTVRDAFSALAVQTAEALALLVGTFWQRTGLRGDVQRLKAELKTRRRVDRAKEILMDRRAMTAEDAFRWIQKRSMDTRRSMREVAETIILSEVSGHYSSIPHALDFSNKPRRK